MTDEQIITNQTEFSEHRPLFEDSINPENKNNDEKQRPWPRRKKALVVFAGVFVLSMALLIAIVPRKSQQQPIDDDTETPAVVEISNDPLQQRINRLKTELESADPSKSNLVFPLVDMNIKLDD